MCLKECAVVDFRRGAKDAPSGPKMFLLPPASVGWGKVIFSLCLFVHRGVLTSLDGGDAPPALRGTPIQPWTGWCPHPALNGGGTPIQPWTGEIPPSSLGQGIPCPVMGVPSPPSRDGDTPRPGMGVPPCQGTPRG